MSYKSLPIICILSILLSSCGLSLQPSVIDATRCSPTVTLSSSASSIYESTSSTINIIATLSCLKSSAENVLVSIGTAGTATEGVDYSVVSDITIIAGNTSGTTTFNPTSDATNEPSNETAILSITGVSGMGATESGTQSVTITINELALNSGTTLIYNSTNATTLANSTEFKY
jgi:hypothetical protein